MRNKLKQEINNIEIPNELSERSWIGVTKAKQEMKKDRKSFNITGIAVAAAFVLLVGIITFINNDLNQTATSPNVPIQKEDGSVVIPAIQLPKENTNADMIGLIVYNGKIYTQTRTEINPEDAKEILGEKLGTTKGTIDEWSKREAYDEEFASTIGKTDVYSVKGYDKDFRIMGYQERDGTVFAEFYENLNGITITSGEDVFGKLNIAGNVADAYFRTFSDWYNSIENYMPVKDMVKLNMFVVQLNNTKPFPRSQTSDPIRNSRNNEQYRELRIHLNDSSVVSLTLLEGGYIYYGHTDVYFQMNKNEFAEIWELVQ